MNRDPSRDPCHTGWKRSRPVGKPVPPPDRRVRHPELGDVTGLVCVLVLFAALAIAGLCARCHDAALLVVSP